MAQRYAGLRCVSRRKIEWLHIALKASKNINITDHFSLPLFVQAIVSPSFDKTYLIAGLSIGF